MLPSLIAVLSCCSALAQSQQDSFNIHFYAQMEALVAGRYDAAAPHRDVLRSYIEETPVDTPGFAVRVQMLSSAYSAADMHAQARAIAEQSLARAGNTAPAATRIALMGIVANAWRDDRNLLKAASYREQALALANKDGQASAVFAQSAELANLYWELGRAEAADAVISRILNIGRDREDLLASFYQSHGQTVNAGTMLQKLVDSAATDPTRALQALNRLAGLYAEQRRYADAAATLQDAIGSAAAAGLSDFANGLREQFAVNLAKAGQVDAADQVYEQSMAGDRDANPLDLALGHAIYLVQTERKSAAESVLKDYLATHSNLPPEQEALILSTLVNTATDDKVSQEYERAAAEMRKTVESQVPEQSRPIDQYLEQAQETLRRDPEEAFQLALAALYAVPLDGSNRKEAVLEITYLASALAEHGAPDKAELLYGKVLALVDSWSADTIEPLLSVTNQYAQFWVNQRDQPARALAAIERYRSALIAARGEGTGWMTDVLRMSIAVEIHRGATGRATILAQDLVALEESLSGTGSRAYAQAILVLAEVAPRN